MKTLIAFFLLICSLNSNSQEIKYKAVFYDQCRETKAPLVKVTNDSGFTGHIWSKDTSITLKDTGIYILSVMNFSTIEKKQIHITEFKDRTETFNLKSILYNSLTFCDPIPCILYYTCNDTIEGWKYDYYYNGNLRCKANFEKGNEFGGSTWLKDTIMNYYENGNLKSIEIYDYKYVQRVASYREYYENGKLKEIYNRDLNYELKYNKTGKVLESNFIRHDELNNFDFSVVKKINKRWIFEYDEKGNLIKKGRNNLLSKQDKRIILMGTKPNYSLQQTSLNQQCF